MAGKIKGITIEIDGNTTGLGKALADVNKRSRDLTSELKQVDRSLKFNPKNVELLAQKQQLLTEQVENTSSKLKQLKDAQAQVEQQYKSGEIGAEQYRAFQRELVETESKLKHYSSQLKEVENQSNTLAQKTKQLGDNMKSAGDKMKSVGSTLSTSVTAPIVGFGALAVETTRELREDLAKLEENARQAGVGVETTEEALKKLNAITGETDSNVEALSNLMAAGLDDNQLKQAVDDLSGAVIKFPDTLKIEGVADGLQETLATGKAIGPFAELLERMGVDLEVFDEGLAKAKESGDEVNYALEQLNSLGLSQVTEGFRENNEALIESADAQFDFMLSLSEIGQTLEPLMTSLKQFATGLMDAFNNLSPAGQKVVLAIAGVAAAIGPLLIIGGQLITSIGSIIGVVTKLGPVFTALTGPIGIAVAAIAGAIAIGVALYKNWDEVSAWLSKTWDAIAKTASKIWNGITDFFKKWGADILVVITGPIGILVKTIIENWDTIKKTTSQTWESIKSITSNVANNIKNSISNIWGGIKNVTQSVWNGIKSAIINPIESAKNTLFNIIDRIKNAFANLKITIPKPKLPHIKVDWRSFGVGDLSVKVPTFDINWYKKGGIFNGPSVIGVGEAGKEAVLPLEGQHMKPFAEEIAKQMNNFIGGVNGQIIVPVYLDGYQIAQAVYPHVDNMQGNSIGHNNRVNGVR